MNEHTKQAALESFSKDTGWELEQIEHYLQCFNENTGNAIENTAGAKVYNWLRAWELATQAESERIATRLEGRAASLHRDGKIMVAIEASKCAGIARDQSLRAIAKGEQEI